MDLIKIVFQVFVKYHFKLFFFSTGNSIIWIDVYCFFFFFLKFKLHYLDNVFQFFYNR